MISNSHGFFPSQTIHPISYSNRFEVICGRSTDLRKDLCAYSNVFRTLLGPCLQFDQATLVTFLLSIQGRHSSNPEVFYACFFILKVI